MAGNAVIGALRVVIGADSAALDKGLKSAQSSLANFGKFAKTTGLLAAGALAGVVGGVGIQIKSALKNIDDLYKLGQSIGIPVEKLSGLAHAADLSGISVENFGTSIVRLSKNMAAIAGGDKTSSAAMAFKAMGISAVDASGKVKSADAVLGEIADKFSKYEDGVNKTAIAVALFGRAGAAMIPLLNQGSAAIREQEAEAAKLGLTFSADTGAKVEAFNDNMTRLGKVASGVGIQLTAGMSDTLLRLSNILVDTAKNAKTLEAASAGLNVAMKVVTTTVLASIYAYKQFVTVIGTAVAAVQKIANLDFKGALEEINSGMSTVKSTVMETYDSIVGVWAPGIDAATTKTKVFNDEAKKIKAPTLPQGGENALQSYLSGIAKRQAALQAEIQTIGMNTAAQEAAKIKLEAMAIAKEKDITLTAKMKAQIDQVSIAYGGLAQRVEEARQMWSFVEGSINTVASNLTDVAMGTKTVQEAFKEMATSIIRDFIQMTIKAQLFRAATAFMGGPVGGYGGFGGIGGFGLALPGFAQGGSFMVGGAGGIDSQVAAMRVTPGERVTVTKDGSMPGGGTFNIVNNNDFRGVDPSMRAFIVAQQRQQNVQLKREILAEVSRTNRDWPGYLSK